MRHALVFVGIGAIVILIGMFMNNQRFTASPQNNNATSTEVLAE